MHEYIATFNNISDFYIVMIVAVNFIRWMKPEQPRVK